MSKRLNRLSELRENASMLVVALGTLLLLSACGSSDLDQAIRRGDAPGVTAAIEAGADIQAPDAHGITPLMAAIRAGRADIAALLVEEGARVRTRDRRGFTALHYAAQNGMTKTVGLLLDRGAPVNVTAGTGAFTPLHLAVIASRDDTVVLLVERGADVKRRNAQGVNAIDIAAGRADDDLIRAIEETVAREAAKRPPDFPPYAETPSSSL